MLDGLSLNTSTNVIQVNNNVNLPESVADHMYRMSMMSFMIADKSINKDKLMKICLVHDLAEAIVGDITPHQNVSKEEKRKLEEVSAFCKV